MRPSPRLLLGSSQHRWVTALTQWVSEHGGAKLVGQALTVGDINPAEFDVLVVDGWSSLLSRRIVTEAQRDGAAVLVLTNPDPDNLTKLGELGVTVTLPLSASPEEIVARAAEIAAVRSTIPATTPAAPPTGADGSERPEHKLLAVLGSSGVVELAVNLAASVAGSGQSVALVDFDTVEPSVAQRLELPLLPNLLTAAEAIRNAEFDSAHVSKHPAGFVVVAGLANPREWDTFGQVEAGDLAAELRSRYGLTVAVTNRMLEDLAPLSGLEARFDVSRRIVSLADDVMVFVPFAPIGLTHGLNLVADVRAITQAPIHIAADRTPKAGFQQTEWTRELTRSFDPATLTLLPDDPEPGRAAWDGRLPTRGRYVKTVRRLAGELVRGWAA